IGQAVSEVLFRFPGPTERNRRPDGAFVSYARWPKGRAVPWQDNAWDVVPDLGIEVLSPNDLAEDLLDKIAEYFRAGVRMVWVVSPLQESVYVYHAVNRITVISRGEELD